MNAKNQKLLADVEEAMKEYQTEATLDSQRNVNWSEGTAVAYFGLDALLSKLERALP